MGFDGLPWDFERQWGLGRPKTGSALHHLVTSSSVKKALMDQEDFAGVRNLARHPLPRLNGECRKWRKILQQAATPMSKPGFDATALSNFAHGDA
jgi:hypothetical protein